MASASISVSGLKELEQQLLSIGALAGAKVLVGAARTAMKPMLEEARALAPQDDEDLIAAIKLAARQLPKNSGSAIEVGLKMAKNKLKGEIEIADGVSVKFSKRNAGWRWHFTEFGTKVRTNKAGANRGKVVAHPFLRPAFDRQSRRALDIFVVEFRKRIERAIKKERVTD